MSVSFSARMALVLAALLCAGAARADYLWLQREGSQLELRAGELGRPAPALPGLQAVQARAAGQPVALQAQAGHLRAEAPADAADLRLSATEPRPGGVLVYHHAKFGRAETKAAGDFELVPAVPGGDTYTLIFKGRPVAASQVNVETSEGWSRVLRPNADGTLTLPTPFAGLYVLEVTARVDSGSVTLDGQTYTDVRHTATLSFEVR